MGKLTGSLRVPLPQSRTRDLADHAGPSHPLDAWKVLGSSRPELSSPSPSRSLSTVATTDPWDAMVAPWRVPSTGMRPTNPNWSPTTPTLPRTEPAKNPHTLDSSTALATRPSPLTPHLHSMPPSRLAQPPLLSRLTRWSSRCTPAVSSTAQSAEPTLTTVSSLSDTELRTDKTTTWLRTHGVHHGATRATSRSPAMVMVKASAESRWPPSALPFEALSI